MVYFIFNTLMTKGGAITFIVFMFISVLVDAGVKNNPMLLMSTEWVDCNNKVVSDPQDVFTLIAVGDLTFSGNSKVNKGVMQPFRNIFHSADFVFANLEGVITERTKPRKPYIPGKSYPFRFPADTADIMKDLSIDAVSIANNHSYDYGKKGMKDMLNYLDMVGIVASGMLNDFTLGSWGGKKIALVAFSPYNRHNNINDISKAKDIVKQAGRQADLVIVSFHGGAEGERNVLLTGTDEIYFGEERGNVREFSKAVIDAGAHLVLGHGPHVLRPLECFNQQLTAYSLANFVASGGLNTRNIAGTTAALEVALSKNKGEVVAVRLWPAHFNYHKMPIPDPNGKAVWLINWLGAQLKQRFDKANILELSGFEGKKQYFKKWFINTKLMRCILNENPRPYCK